MTIRAYRAAVVTGANRGIGAAVVRVLCARGLEVHAIARSAEPLADLARATGCVPHALDVGDRGAVAAALEGLAVDVLVNNAAAVATGGPSFETTVAQLDELLRVNIAGVVNSLAAVVPGMKARGRGHIVNLGSTSGHHAMAGMPAYGMTKAAIHNLSQTLRLDLHGSGIRVTEIVPGRVETGIHLRLMEDRAAAQRLFYDDVVPLQPEDVAAAILFVLEAPQRMDVTLMEIMPTDSVNGGTAFAKRAG